METSRPRYPCGSIDHDGGYWLDVMTSLWYCPDCPAGFYYREEKDTVKIVDGFAYLEEKDVMPDPDAPRHIQAPPGFSIERLPKTDLDKSYDITRYRFTCNLTMDVAVNDDVDQHGRRSPYLQVTFENGVTALAEAMIKHGKAVLPE